MLPIFRSSYKHGLKEDDLFDPLDEHKSNKLGEQLEKFWRQEHRKHRKAALHIALFRMFGWQFAFLGIIKLIDEIMLV